MEKVGHGFYEGHFGGRIPELMELSLAAVSEMSIRWHKASACAVISLSLFVCSLLKIGEL